MTVHSRALLDLCTLISPDIEKSDKVLEIIISEETPWMEIIDFANQHLMIPTLYSMLLKRDLLTSVKDELIVEYLTTVYKFNQVRNESIIIQLQDICHLFSQIGVTPVLLKGAAALSEGYYHGIGARVMSDIDILVPENKIKECIELLETKGGYKPVDSDAPLWLSHQYRRIYSDNGVAALELHYHALIERCRSFLPDEELIEHVKPSRKIENAYVMEPSFDLYHIFLHSELQDSSHKNYTLPLRGLYHAATIVTACHDEINWNVLSEKTQNHDLSTVWSDYLYMLNRLFDTKVPSIMMGSSAHFLKIIDQMETCNKKEPKVQLFFDIVKGIFSYERLKIKYNLKSRLAYPFAFIRSLYDLLVKYIFTSKGRKRLFKYIENYMKTKQFGSRAP